MALASGFKVNTNTTSLQTYRSYSKSQAGLEQNIERLSSGLRINRAADDTAGQAISQRMRNQATGMRQAVRNSQQATNYLQTAEGGLNEIHNILGRMRELAVQSASDGVNGDDRASIDLEFQQLKAEITRIGDGTEYNNMKLIDGSKAKSLATSGNSAEGATKVATDSVKVASFTTSGTYAVVSKDATTMELYLQNEDATTYSQVDQFVKAEGDIDLSNEIHFDDAGIVFKLDSSYNKASSALEVTVGGSEGAWTIDSADQHHLIVDSDEEFTTVQVGANNDAEAPAGQASVADNVTENRITFNIADTTSEGLGISTIDLDSLGEAQSAINYLDAAIQKVNDERSNIGSLQNRFEFTSSNLLNSIQNNSASMSTIRDADFAVEAADLARNQILTQSGTAMLAQANQISQNVLSLLR